MELQVMGTLHKYLTSLDAVEGSLATKSLVIGYKKSGMPYKMVTLHGEQGFRCVVLHVDAGNPNSSEGKANQKMVQETLSFQIEEIRSFPLKNHEAYIPFEMIDSNEKLEYVKGLIVRLFD